MAADSGFDAGGEGGVRNLRRHVGLPDGDGSDGDAGSVCDQPEPGQQQRMPIDAGQWIHAMHERGNGHIWHRSKLARGLRTDLAGVRAARSALGAGGIGHLLRNQGHARNAGVSSQHVIRLAQRTRARHARLGFVYRTSGGNSTRNAGQVQLRRRLRSGFTARVDYTWAKAMDDDAQVGARDIKRDQCGNAGRRERYQASISGPTIAQNWLDLLAERSLSTFDQRQLLSATIQYTTGMGMGGELMSGWRGRLLKEWTVMSQITIGTGLPETPIYLAAVPGTGFTGTIRPNVTGAPIYSGTCRLPFESWRHSPRPSAGAWGTARRNSITGPNQFSLNCVNVADAAADESFQS